MSKKSKPSIRSSAAEYLTFVAATGSREDSVEIRYEDENIWLTQKMMATLYGISVPAINQHLKRIFADHELEETSVVKESLTTAADGKDYRTKHYNPTDRRGPYELVHDGRWNGYETPPTGNANYAWILHMVSKLSDWSGATKTTRQGCPKGERGGANQNGVAGFALANGSMSTNTKGDCHTRSATKMPKASLQSLTRQGEIRQQLVENDLVDCMIAFNKAPANPVPLAA